MKKWIRKLLSLFLQGLLALLPLIITAWVGVLIFRFFEHMIEKVIILIPWPYREIGSLVFLVEVAALVAFFLAVAIFGILVKTIVGKALVGWIDSLFSGIPFLSTVYRATRQMIDLFLTRKKSFLTHPVLVEYPSPGIWAVGFNTGDTGQKLLPEGQQRCCTVFIPHTPNPTSGFLGVVPTDKVRPLNISVEDAIKLVLTGGMVKPP
jgi:uncharacterized membrane protein